VCVYIFLFIFVYTGTPALIVPLFPPSYIIVCVFIYLCLCLYTQAPPPSLCLFSHPLSLFTPDHFLVFTRPPSPLINSVTSFPICSRLSIHTRPSTHVDRSRTPRQGRGSWPRGTAERRRFFRTAYKVTLPRFRAHFSRTMTARGRSAY